MANPVCNKSMSPGSTTTPSAAMISSSMARSTLRHSCPRWCARSTRTPRPCTPCQAMCSSPRWCAKARWAPPSPRASAPGADEVDPGAVAVVVDGLFDTVPVGVELGADVGQRVPLGRVLQRQGHDVVSPDVDVLGVAPVLHLAHADVVEGGRLALHVLGRGDHRRVTALVQCGPARIVERQAEAEADARLRPRGAPWSTLPGVTRLMRPSSSSSPQSPQVEPGGRCFHRFVTVSFPPGRVAMYRPVGLPSGEELRAVAPVILVHGRKGQHMPDKPFVVSADGHILEPTDLFITRLPEAPARPGRVGGRLRDRATGRGRGARSSGACTPPASRDGRSPATARRADACPRATPR